jgi:predicted RNase H-like HicB family nuclease
MIRYSENRCLGKFGQEGKMKYRVLIEQDEDGVFVAEVPALPGCVSQGHTRKEALQNIQEAIAAYLESLKAHNEPIPPSIYEEVVEVAM